VMLAVDGEIPKLLVGCDSGAPARHHCRSPYRPDARSNPTEVSPRNGNRLPVVRCSCGHSGCFLQRVGGRLQSNSVTRARLPGTRSSDSGPASSRAPRRRDRIGRPAAQSPFNRHNTSLAENAHVKVQRLT
jgi:hypothetical protein